jgi:hypothetical protein
MKKLLMGLGLVVLLAGCASRENDNGMGGTSDQYQSTTSDQSMKTDSINKDSSGNSTDQFHNNAVNGTGSSTATNNNTGQP